MTEMNLLLATIILSTITVLTFLWYARKNIFHPVVLVTGIFGYFVVAPAAYLMVTNNFVYGHAAPTRRLVSALTLLTVGYMAIITGYQFSVLPSIRKWVPVPDSETAIDARTLLAFGIAGMGVGIASFTYFTVVNGGFVRLMTVTPRTAFQTVPDTGRYRMMGIMGVVGGWLTVWIALRPVLTRGSWSLRSREGVLLVGTLAITIGFVVLTRERLKFVLMIAFLLSYIASVRDSDIRKIALVFGASLLFLGVVSRFIIHVIIGHPDPVRNLFLAIINSRRLEAFMVIVDSVPSRHPYQFGETYGRTFVTPQDSNAYDQQVESLLRDRQVDAVGFSGMVFGEMWLNFGPVGIAVVSMLYGIFLRIASDIQRIEVPVWRGVGAVLVAGCVVSIPAASTWITRVPIMQGLVPVLSAIAAAFLWKRYYGGRRHADGELSGFSD